jgi:hypothetical protein
MKVRKVIKRLGAVATAGAMLGATVMGALAADLGSYPNMFVTDGTFNGYFVVGERAAAVDNLAMTDIATGMKYTKSGSGSVSVSGDAWMVGTSAKKLEMANTNSTPVGEQIYDVETFISDSELGALADGEFSTSGSSSTYTQYLYFDIKNQADNEIVVFAEDDEDVVADFLYFKSGDNIGEYVLEFASSPESTMQDTAGSASTSGTVLDDFENTKLNMLGMEFDIVLARRPQSTPEDSIKLTLMGGSASGSLLEGESTSLSVKGKTYDVSLVFVDTTYAKFTVNGEQSDKLQKGDTFQLADGTEIGVSEILYQSYAGGVHSSDFFIGASKVELRDNTITNTASSSALKVGTETISGADVVIEGTDDNTTFTLTKLRINMTAQDDYFVPAGGKLSEAVVAQGDDKELVFTNNWDIEYHGLTEEATHEIRLHSSTDRKYKLQFYDGDNDMVDMPLFYATNSTNIQFSEDATDKEVILNEGLNATKNDYIVLTQGTPSSGTAKTYVLQYKGSDKSTATSPKIRFKNLGSGETIEYAVNTGSDNTVATVKLGGFSWAVQNESSKGTADFTVRVDQDGDGSVEDGQDIDIVDSYGMLLDITNISISSTGQLIQPAKTNESNSILTWTVPNSNDYDDQKPPQIDLTVDATATNEVTFSTLQLSNAAHNLITPEGEENTAYGYTTAGAKLTYTTPSSSPAGLTIEYPENQRLPQVYVTSGATASASTGGTLAAVEVVDATRLDSEIASVSSNNLVVVGGPCVNTVAAELLGNPSDCAEGFRPGVARVKLFENGDNMAMLVAGYSGQDTRLAGQVLARSERWAQLSGDEVEIEGTTASDATIAAPQPVVVVAEEPAAAEADAEVAE